MPGRPAAAFAAERTSSAKPAALGLRSRFVYIQGAAIEVRPIQFGDRAVRLRGISHLDERKSTRTASIPVCYHIHSFYGSVAFK